MSKHFTSILSTLFGAFANISFPPPLQRFINRTYVTLLGVDLSDFESAKEYRTLNALFSRNLKKPREFSKNPQDMISPVDGLITDTSIITDAKAYQIKGVAYRLEELLGSYHTQAVVKLEGGNAINLYLSPKDYHRYHFPTDLHIHSLTHIPGKLFPVNFPFLKHKKSLFVENERVVIEATDNDGRILVMVLVGALNVGKMHVAFEPKLQTNIDTKQPTHYSYDNLQVSKGSLCGWFEMGSTVLLFIAKETIILSIAINQKVKFGETLAIVRHNKAI